jgi:ATP-dependent Clp protease, protease subunit
VAHFTEDLSDLDADQNRLPPFEVVSSKFEVQQHNIYLSDGIGHPIEYVPILSALRLAGEHDQFTFYLNTEGGRLSTGLQLINAIRDTAAHVTMVLDPWAYSMGALLFLTGHELIIPDTSQLMFHNYSGGSPMGKGHEQLAEVQASMKSFERVMRQVCQGFLTPEEIKGVMSGQDLWLDADEIRARLAKMKDGASEPPAVTPRRTRKKPVPTENAGQQS